MFTQTWLTFMLSTVTLHLQNYGLVLNSSIVEARPGTIFFVSSLSHTHTLTDRQILQVQIRWVEGKRWRDITWRKLNSSLKTNQHSKIRTETSFLFSWLTLAADKRAGMHLFPNLAKQAPGAPKKKRKTMAGGNLEEIHCSVVMTHAKESPRYPSLASYRCHRQIDLTSSVKLFPWSLSFGKPTYVPQLPTQVRHLFHLFFLLSFFLC